MLGGPCAGACPSPVAAVGKRQAGQSIARPPDGSDEREVVAVEAVAQRVLPGAAVEGVVATGSEQAGHRRVAPDLAATMTLIEAVQAEPTTE